MLKNILKLLISLLNVGKHLFKRPVTLEYPEKKNSKPENFRGVPVVNKCIKCGTCIKVCPSGAIQIEENQFFIDLKKCIFCGNCSYYCPVKAIKMSDKYETAVSDKNELILTYDIKVSEVKDV